jgi:urea transport system substrate-binding protein
VRDTARIDEDQAGPPENRAPCAVRALKPCVAAAAMGLTLGVATAAGGLVSPSLFARPTVKVGALHSLSGTMAISETVLKDVAQMTFDEINRKCGVMGHMIQPVVVDPASNWPLFAEKARQLLTQDKFACAFGCRTSVSRKSVLPVFEELNGLRFYPVQYEGEELSYCGAPPLGPRVRSVELGQSPVAEERFHLRRTEGLDHTGTV